MRNAKMGSRRQCVEPAPVRATLLAFSAALQIKDETSNLELALH
jgi:hypothetical protein